MRPEAFDQALLDVPRHFPSPGAIADSAELEREQKIKLLQQWEQDLRLEMVTAEENMPGQRPGQNRGGAAERFRNVRAALKSLGIEGADKPAGATKLG
jgi:hypothetical protein